MIAGAIENVLNQKTRTDKKPMNDDRANVPFLATTALEELWDVKRPIIFLGDWCTLYQRRSYWKTLEGRLVGTPYDNASAVKAAYDYTSDLYEKILPLLGKSLNAIHGKERSYRYWRILLGPWLRLYLSVVYDRFVHIKQALELYPDCTTIGLCEKSFMVPTDTLDFAYALSDDIYNLQLFTKILHVLGREFPCKEISRPRSAPCSTSHDEPWSHRAINAAAKAYVNVSARYANTVLLRSSYFSSRVTMSLVVKNPGHVLPSWNRMTPSAHFETNSVLRSQLKSLEIGEGAFECCLAAMLCEDIPQCFIEGFQATEKGALGSYPERTTAIFSANGWYYDECFKQWAATRADAGALLLGTQHGGDYGSLRRMPSEDHETSIVDRYYSWGWERINCAAKVIPMPATKFSGRNQIGADNAKTGILWVSTTAPRYHLLESASWPFHFREYLAWQIRFGKALSQHIMQELSFRPHYVDGGWDVAQRLKDCVPDIRVETWEMPFQKRLENCRLYICDHLSTTFADALAANKPTILFWNPQTNDLRPEAQSYYDLLRNNGILFDTPEAAAAAVNEVYEDVETWWNQPDRQAAIKMFCNRFARTSSNTVALWNTEFKRIVAGAASGQ